VRARQRESAEAVEVVLLVLHRWSPTRGACVQQNHL
jgi:hypothetical protein